MPVQTQGSVVTTGFIERPLRCFLAKLEVAVVFRCHTLNGQVVAKPVPVLLRGVGWGARDQILV